MTSPFSRIQIGPQGLGDPVGWEIWGIWRLEGAHILCDAEKRLRVHQPLRSEKPKQEIERHDHDYRQEEDDVLCPLRGKYMDKNHGHKDSDTRCNNRHRRIHVNKGKIKIRSWSVYICIGQENRQGKNNDHPRAVYKRIERPGYEKLLHGHRHRMAEFKVFREVEIGKCGYNAAKNEHREKGKKHHGEKLSR